MTQVVTRKRKTIEPFPDGKPDGHPAWQDTIAKTRVAYPQGHSDLERELKAQWEAL